MAFPTLLVNSATGNDAQASGAGPTTALAGTSASTSADGLTVTLDGSPDLSGVATDGSAVIYLADSTAGARNFGAIIAADNTAKTVTLPASGGLYSGAAAQPFGASLTGKSWAIGGKRATAYQSTSSGRLFNNNSTNGDAMPGWTIQLASGHVEPATTTTVHIYRSGDQLGGEITLQAEPGASVLPVLQYNNTGTFFLFDGSANTGYWVLKNLEPRALVTNGASTCFVANSNANSIRFIGIKMLNASFKFGMGFYVDCNGLLIQDSTVANCVSTGIKIAGNYSATLDNAYIYGNGAEGLLASGTTNSLTVQRSILARNATNGITFSAGPTNSIGNYRFDGNFIDSNTLAGIAVSTTNAVVLQYLNIINNQVTHNGGAWLAFTGTGVNQTFLKSAGVRILGNNYHGNGNSNATSPLLPLIEAYSTQLDPQYPNAAGGDFRVMNPALWGGAYPPASLPIGGTSITSAYTTAGAAQVSPTVAAFRRITMDGGF